MYRRTSLTCPVCSTPLEEISAPLPVHGCTGCGGAWLGPEAAVHLLRDEFDLVSRGVVAASLRIPSDHKPHPEPEYGRMCARCQQPMSTLRVRSIRLETCPHGTWFDRNEVKGAADELQTRRSGRDDDAWIDLLALIERWLFNQR